MHIETATIPGCNTTGTQPCQGSSKMHYPAQCMHTTQQETERDQPGDGWPWLWSCSRFHQSKWSVAYVLDYPIMYPPRKKIAHFTSNMVCTCLFVCLFWSHAQLHISEYNSPGRHQDTFSIRTSAWKCLTLQRDLTKYLLIYATYLQDSCPKTYILFLLVWCSKILRDCYWFHLIVKSITYRINTPDKIPPCGYQMKEPSIVVSLQLQIPHPQWKTEVQQETGYQKVRIACDF